MEKEDIIYWLWLSLVLKTGSVLPSALLKFFSSPKKIYEAEREDLDSIDADFYGHKEDLMNKDLSKAESILKYCRENDIGIMTPDDYFYPDRFRLIPNKPIVMYYLGNFIDLDNSFNVGMVGSRIPSEYASHAAKRISFDLAKSKAVVISGVASGIDALSHKGALFAEGFTVGVLGCGIDRIYPKENEKLYEDIIKKGLLITEYPPSSAPLASHFPIRNRLIAALSDAVCVIEGSEQSGSLITAEYAMNYGKKLYAVPGSIFAACSAGSNFLLKIGASPLLSAYDVLYDFKDKYPFLRSEIKSFGEKSEPKKKKINVKKKISKYVFAGVKRQNEGKEIMPPEYDFIEINSENEGENPNRAADANIFSLSESEREVYSKISFEPIFADSLVSDEMNISKVMVVLTKLEMKGLVKKEAGGRFVLNDRAEN